MLNIRSPEHTFTAALTHDIGKVVLGTAVDALSYRPSHHVMAQLGLRFYALDEIVYEVLNELMRVRTVFKFNQKYPQ